MTILDFTELYEFIRPLAAIYNQSFYWEKGVLLYTQHIFLGISVFLDLGFIITLEAIHYRNFGTDFPLPSTFEYLLSTWRDVLFQLWFPRHDWPSSWRFSFLYVLSYDRLFLDHQEQRYERVMCGHVHVLFHVSLSFPATRLCHPYLPLPVRAQESLIFLYALDENWVHTLSLKLMLSRT